MDPFEIYETAEGDSLSKLRQAGFYLENLKENEIITKDDFKRIIEKEECLKKEDLRRELKKIYKNKINLEEILKIGEPKFNEEQMKDAMRFLPKDEDGSINIDELIEFLFIN